MTTRTEVLSFKFYDPQGHGEAGGPEGDCPAEHDGYLCTLETGHDGFHEAWGSTELFQVWAEVEVHEDQGYQGWANRETWCLVLHLDNDQGLHEGVLDDARHELSEARENPSDLFTVDEEARYRLATTLREAAEAWHADFFNGEHEGMRQEVVALLSDVGSLYRVDWDEVARHFLDSVAEEDEAPRECVWAKVGDDEAGEYFHCSTHDRTELGNGEGQDPFFPCEGWLDEVNG